MNMMERALHGIPRKRLMVLVSILLGVNLLSWLGAFGLEMLQPGILGLAGLAWVFGARNAFDADHIAAIDNVTRKLRHEGKQSIGVGFFFALGHSTIVIILSAAIVLGARGIKDEFGDLSHFGGVVGTTISALFLTVIGILNLLILLQLFKVYRNYRRGPITGALGEDAIEDLLAKRGMMARGFRFLFRRIRRSGHMYPLGILFGLGFDTATEIAVLGLSATLATTAEFPLWGIMVFPLLFTAGMTLMDSIDGLVMFRAYHWALSDVLRRLYFNITITGMAVGVALIIGTLEWLQLVELKLEVDSGFWRWLGSLDFGVVGFAVVLLMLGIWAVAVVLYRWRSTPRVAVPSTD